MIAHQVKVGTVKRDHEHMPFGTGQAVLRSLVWLSVIWVVVDLDLIHDAAFLVSEDAGLPV